jgi:hypothetical protein
MLQFLSIVCLIVNIVYGESVRFVNNGHLAKPHQFPSVLYLSSGCTATIINENMFITAAHCVCRNVATADFVHTEATNMNNIKTSGKAYRVKKLIVEPSYERLCKQVMIPEGNDVAVGKIEGKFPLSKKVQAAKLGKLANTPLTIVGFGLDARPKKGKNTVLVLKYGYLNSTMSCPEHCMFINGICYRQSSNTQIPNHGDSGGPMFNKKGELVGVCSGYEDDIGLHASIADNMSFIRKAIETLKKYNE